MPTSEALPGTVWVIDQTKQAVSEISFVLEYERRKEFTQKIKVARWQLGQKLEHAVRLPALHDPGPSRPHGRPEGGGAAPGAPEEPAAVIDAVAQDLRQSLAAVPPEALPRASVDVGWAVKRFLEKIDQASREVRAETASAQDQLTRLRDEVERELRRRQLANPSSEVEFFQAVCWLTENGEGEELELVRRARRSPPFRSQQIDQLLATAEQEIRARSGSDDPPQESGDLPPPFPAPDFFANRNRIPDEELLPHVGKWVAFNDTGTEIVASAPDLGALERRLTEAGTDPGSVVLEYVPDDDDFCGGGGML